MNIIVNRVHKSDQYTIGKMYIDGHFFCDTLEDVIRDVKIPNETAIPSGEYKVVLTMSRTFKRVLPLLLGVDGFTGIRIHRGNDAGDTSGCILLGENKAKGKVLNSTQYEVKLIEKMITHLYNEFGEEIKLTIV